MDRSIDARSDTPPRGAQQVAVITIITRLVVIGYYGWRWVTDVT